MSGFSTVEVNDNNGTTKQFKFPALFSDAYTMLLFVLFESFWRYFDDIPSSSLETSPVLAIFWYN